MAIRNERERREQRRLSKIRRESGRPSLEGGEIKDQKVSVHCTLYIVHCTVYFLKMCYQQRVVLTIKDWYTVDQS